MSSKATPRLALFGNIPGAVAFMKKILQDTFEDAVDITAYLLNDMVDPSIPTVIASHKDYYTAAKQAFPNSTIIVAAKVLLGFNLDALTVLPSGKKVLVVNTPQGAVLETINNLIDVGIKHLDFIPYVPGNEIPADCDTAISVGLLHICPQDIKNKIDIGYRSISTDSFNQLLLALGLGSNYLDKFNNQFKLPLIQGNDKIAKKIEQINILNDERDIIINKIPDGILSISEDKTILALNTVMETIIGRPKALLIGELIQPIIAEISNVNDLLYDLEEILNAQININGTSFLYSCVSMQKGNSVHYIFTFKREYQVALIEERAQLELLRKGYVAKYDFKDIWGTVPAITEMKKTALSFAKNNVTILISGESGTGKELLAQAIHNNSNRCKNIFLPVNFAALPESLLESELFGYEEGAFTGAKKGGKLGYFEMASGGTIFIDEIGDMPLALQPRLLRILQEREVIRLGGSKIIPIDVRIIAATNKDLRYEVANGRFRADLYYRLNILAINTIPLRQFKENIELIIKTYLSTKYNFTISSIDKEALVALNKYNWPGNVRELVNVADYIYYTSDGSHSITIKNIPNYIFSNKDYSLLSNQLITRFETKNIPSKPKISEQELFVVILETLKENPNINGRRTLIKALSKKSIEVTEHYLKAYLNNMKKDGLIKVGITKQGTVVTKQGLDYLSKNG